VTKTWVASFQPGELRGGRCDQRRVDLLAGRPAACMSTIPGRSHPRRAWRGRERGPRAPRSVRGRRSLLPLRFSRLPSPTWEGFKADDPVGSKASAPIAHAPIIRPVAQRESVFPVPALYPCVALALDEAFEEGLPPIPFLPTPARNCFQAGDAISRDLTRPEGPPTRPARRRRRLWRRR
jgi:hypothetical protein